MNYPVPNAPTNHWCTDWCTNSFLVFSEGGDELAAEVGDVRDDAAPDEVALPEGRLVHPGRACVLQVVFDPEGSRRAGPIDYAGRDRNQPAVADDTDGLVPLVYSPDEVEYFGVAPQL